MMFQNTAGQKIGAQMVSVTDGSAFTGTVTVYITGDAGTQAIGSVSSGVCTHEGRGYHTYAPSQAETNYDLIAFTFTGTGAIPVTVQVYPELTSDEIVDLLENSLTASEFTLVSLTNSDGTEVEFYGNADHDSNTQLITFTDTTGDALPFNPAVYTTVELHVLLGEDDIPTKIGTAQWTVTSQPGATLTISLSHEETARMQGSRINSTTTYKQGKTSIATIWAINPSNLNRYVVKRITSWKAIETVW